jgi:hypothetical protein
VEKVDHGSIKPDSNFLCGGRDPFAYLGTFSDDGGGTGISWLRLADKLLSIDIDQMDTRSSEFLRYEKPLGLLWEYRTSRVKLRGMEKTDAYSSSIAKDKTIPGGTIVVGCREAADV